MTSGIPVGAPVISGTGNYLAGDASEVSTKFDAEVALWQPPILSPDRATQHNKRSNDARVHEMEQNDSQIAGANQLHKDSIVGDQFRLNCRPNLQVLGITGEAGDAWGEAFELEVEAKFANWAESIDCLPDATRHNTFTDLIRLAVGIFMRSGEFLASAEMISPEGPFGSHFATAIKILDLDRLSNPNLSIDTRFIHNGVEVDSNRSPLAYWIREAHQNDYWADSDTSTWKRHPKKLPWGRDNIIHIVEQKRPDQSRGFSDIYTTLKGSRLLWKLRDSTIQSAILQASVAMTMEAELPEQAAAALFGPGQQSGITQTAHYLEMVNQFTGGGKGYRWGGVKVPHLFPGMKLQMRPAGSSSGGVFGTDSEASFLRYICAGLGVSYEEFTRDFSKVSYSSLKGTLAQTRRYMRARKKMIADRLATIIYRLWLEEAYHRGEIQALKDPRCPDFYAPGMKDAYTRCSWLGAGSGQIDELKETQSAGLRVKFNLSTLEIECAKLGNDWREIILQKARERRFCEANGIAYDDVMSADMMNALEGAAHNDPNEGQPENVNGETK